MAQRDYYQVLNVERDADGRTIKKAYRALALKYHPDRNSDPEAEMLFKEASEAYEVLSDTKKRQLFDQHGFAGLKNSGFSGFDGVGIDDIFSSFGDIFGDLFGFGRQRRYSGRGRDIRLRTQIKFEEAVFGCEKDVSIEQYVACTTCAGSGAKPGSSPSRCGTCKGRGQVVHGQGMFLISNTCPDCGGQGTRNDSPCSDCNGEGRTVAEREVHIKIPAGFDHGMSLRYAGEGEPGSMGAPAGHLYVDVLVENHESLQREGEDLVTEAHVDMVQAALGCTIEVVGAEGTEEVKVPKGSQPNDVITLKKRGVPRLRGEGRGDLHVVCRVQVPTNLSSKEKKLLEEFSDLRAGKKPKKGRRKSFF